MKAGKIVNESILGEDFKTVLINGKAYTIYPPTIHRIAGAAKCLSDIGEEVRTMGEYIASLSNMECVGRALSWFIMDDESLADELCHGADGELLNALGIAFSLVSMENFIRLSDLARNIVSLTAKQKL